MKEREGQAAEMMRRSSDEQRPNEPVAEEAEHVQPADQPSPTDPAQPADPAQPPDPAEPSTARPGPEGESPDSSPEIDAAPRPRTGVLGTNGPQLSRSSPFYVGFVGGIGALTAWFLGTMLVSARGVLMLIVVALYLAMGLNPLVEWCVRRRVPRGVGVVAVFVGLLAVFALIVTAVIPVVTQQLTALLAKVPVWIDQLRNNRTIREVDQKYDITQKVEDYITQGDLAQQAAGGLVGFGVVVVSTLFAAFTLLVLTLYFLGSLPATLRAVYRLVPRSRRDRVRYLGDRVVDRIGRYVGGQLLVAGTAGAMSFIFLSIAGLGEFAMALAVAVAVFDLIPLIGGAISAVVVTSIGFLTSIPIGIACAIYYVTYQQIENYLILPRVMTRAVSVPGTIVVVGALLGGSLFGMVGALLAVPTAAAVLLIVREVIEPRQEAS